MPGTCHEYESELRHLVHEFRGEVPTSLELWGEQNNFSEQQFALVCDIAAEAWGNAAVRWQELNQAPLDMYAVAKEVESYRAQKVRNLYRPTY